MLEDIKQMADREAQPEYRNPDEGLWLSDYQFFDRFGFSLEGRFTCTFYTLDNHENHLYYRRY